MRQRLNGFTSFMKKLDGDKDYDYIPETTGIGGELYQRYECLLELLRGAISWGEYLERINQLRYKEGMACYRLRKDILGLDIPYSQVGVYVTDRCYYRQAIKYLREYQESERQAELPRGFNTRVSLSDTSDVYLSQLEDAYGRLSGSTSSTTRSR